MEEEKMNNGKIKTEIETENKSEKDTFARNWVFTQNNPTQTDEEFYSYLENLSHVKYFVFCREKAPTTGTIHFQGYIEFVQSKRFSTICSYLPKTHIMPRGGSKRDCIDYVKKQGKHTDKKDTQIGTIFEFGDTSEERARNDLEEIRKAVLIDGESPREILLNRNVNIQQLKLADRLYAEHMNSIYSETKRIDIKVSYYWGEPGTGKTSKIFELFKPSEFYRVTNYKNPFDNYNYQKILVLDEFEDCHFDLEFINSLIDIYPCELPCRFYNKWAAYDKVIIISNTPLYQQYKYSPKQNTFKRRIHEIKEFKHSTKTNCTEQKAEQITFTAVEENDPICDIF